MNLTFNSDFPSSDTVVLAAEGIGRPSSVCLPYNLVPGMDTSSPIYQKAVALLNKQVAPESSPAKTLAPFDRGMS
jgi:hypothetical protein